MSRVLRLTIVLSLLLSLLPVLPRQAAAAESSDVSNLIADLQFWAVIVDGIAGLGVMDEKIPFTDVSLGDRDALSLQNLLNSALSGLVAGTLPDLQTALENADTTLPSGMEVRFDNVAIVETDNVIDLGFTLNLNRPNTTIPLAFNQGGLALDRGQVDLSFTGNGAFSFKFDTSVEDTNQRFFLDAIPTLTFGANAQGNIGGFDNLLGFAKTTVGGAINLDLDVTAVFHDPDGDGRLTKDEIASTALSDLITVDYVDDAATNAIDAALTLDADIVPGSPDAAVTWVDATLTDGPASPDVQLNALKDFQNVSAAEVLGGLGQLATAVLAGQKVTDLPLPFLQEELSDVFSFADPLVSFLKQQGEAAILCGTVDGNPPTGNFFDLPGGTNVFCQAVALENPTSVTWKIDGNAVGVADALNTVGINPSASAPLTLGANGLDSLTLEFNLAADEAGVVHSVRPMFLNAQDLAAKLVELAGFDANQISPLYDPATRSLTYRLVKNSDPAPKTTTLDFGDQLAQATSMIGLSPTVAANVQVDPGNAALDVTFGVILVENVDDIVPGGSIADRFFLKVRNGAGEHEFSADASVLVDNLALEGRLGFLRVEAVGDATASAANTAFAIGRADAATPMLAADFVAPGINVGGASPFAIADAVRLPTLLNNLGTNLSAVCNVQMAGGLRAGASLGETSVSGKVGLAWPNVFATGCTPDPGNLTVNTDSGFDTDLKAFDIDADNPLALLSLILDSFDDLVSGIESVSGANVAALDTQLPLVGATPRDLIDGVDELQAELDAIRTNPPDTLQELEVLLESQLGIDSSALGFSLENLETGDTGKELIVRLGYTRGVTVPKQINLDLGSGLASIAGLQANNSFELASSASAQLHMGIPLKLGVSLDDVFVVDTTGLVVDASVDAPNVGVTANAGPIAIDLSGQALLDAQVAVQNPGTATANEAIPLPQFLSGLDASLTGPVNDCGVVDGDKALTGAACARLDATLAGTPLGTVGFRAEDLAAPDDLSSLPGWFVFVPADLQDNILTAVLDWTLLVKVLPKLLDTVQVTLDGSASDLTVPLVGDALDAGGNLVDELNTKFVTPVSTALADLEAAAGMPATDFAATVQTRVFSALSGTGILGDSDGNGTAGELADVSVTCGSAACDGATDVTDIDDLQVSFLLRDGISATPDFDLGIPGLPLDSQGSLQAQVDWRLRVGFGLSRNDGPYLVIQDGGDPEFQVGAAVTLGDSASSCFDGAWPTDFDNFAHTAGDAANRCLDGTLGFLKVNIHDGDGAATPETDDDRTELGLTTRVDFSSASGDRLKLVELVNGNVDVTPQIDAGATVNLAIRTAVDAADSASLPSVVTAFHLNWDIVDNTGDPQIAFDDLYLDTGTFVGQFLEPTVGGVRQVLQPIQPVVDTLQAPLPVLSDLAELVGEPPVSLLSLMEAASESDLSLVRSVISFANLAGTLPSDCSTDCFLGLGQLSSGERVGGAFSIDAAKALAGPLTPDRAASLILPSATQPDNTPGTNLIDEIAGGDKPVPDARPGTFGVPGLTFPFMDDASKIFGLLMGQDIVLVRYDAGTANATAGIAQTYGPILVGPVPISIGLSGAAAFKARFAMGYDTSGLRKVIGDGSAGDVLDGIFIDDLDVNGNDVPEIQLVGTVAASAGVEAVIISAGVEGGITLTVALDLDDRPNPDGKLRIDEIVDRLDNPICLFVTSGSLDAFLAAFVRVGFSFFSKTFRYEIANINLLDFSNQCDDEDKVTPELARVENGELILHMGPEANQRGVETGVVDEEFVVRQLTAGLPARYAVTAFGITMEYPKNPADAPTITSIRADGGDGNDVIALEPGAARQTGVHNGGNDAATLSDASAQFVSKSITVNATLKNLSDGSNCVVTALTQTTLTCTLAGGAENDWDDGDSYQVDATLPFVAVGNLNGGDGNDQLSGGSAADVLAGGPGNDKISGRSGNDTINGEAGDDTLNGDLGDDTIDGGLDNDAIAGGPGSDTLYGGAGDDDLSGGPHTANNPDGADTIAGGPGNDSLDGAQGDDFLYGDEILTDCNAGGAADGGDDLVIGSFGNDQIWGGFGNDVLIGSEDHDQICGNAGADFLDGDDDDSSTPDGNDSLNGGSGPDEIHGRGGDDDIVGKAGADTVFGDNDNDDISGGDDSDTVFGGAGRDYIFGDNGSVVRPADQPDATSVVFDETAGAADELHGGDDNDVIFGEGGDDSMFGDAGADQMAGNGGADTMRGGADDDEMHGNTGDDTMFGDSGDDTMHGNTGADTMRGGTGNDTLFGNEDNDTMFGDADRDFLYGNTGDDTMHGNAGDDYLEGNEDNDTMRGGAGQDDLIGGTVVAGTPDGGDTIFGGNGAPGLNEGDFDVILGDNGTIVRPTDANGGWITNTFNAAIRRNVTLFDVATVESTPNANTSGGDSLFGEANDDILYGQGGNDTLSGGDGHDYLEGNAGDDMVKGDAGEDDLLGGTGLINDDPPAGVNGRVDGNDVMAGESNDAEGTDTGSGADVMLGDNGIIARPLDATGQWIVQSFNDDIARQVTLLDVATLGSMPGAASSGDDRMWGNDNDDILFGQGGNDEVYGNAGADTLEGNAGADTLYGGGGEDDIIGGGSANDGVIDTDRVGDGLLDEGDLLYGDDGDNDAATNGDDSDSMAGDNARISRPTDETGAWQIDPNDSGIVVREVVLFDVEIADGNAIDASVSGSDRLYGEGGRDFIFGQGNDNVDADGDGRFNEDPADGFDNDRDGRESEASLGYDCLDGVDNDGDGLSDAGDPDCIAAIDEDGGGDELRGGPGDDHVEGNHGSDWIFGDDGDDDIWGGGSADSTGLVGAGTPPTGLADGDDVINGGNDDDVLLADNGLIVRLVDGAGIWLRHNGFGFDMVQRNVTVTGTPEVDGAFGDDHLRGDSGEDDLYGQQGHDLLEGNDGEDAIVGDLGKITSEVQDGTNEQVTAPPGPFFEETIFAEGTFYRLVELYAFLDGDGAAGNDTLLGGDGRDSLHGGAGDDILNGDGDATVLNTDPNPATADQDKVFGGDGNDVAWGGRGDDNVWGGYGDDHLDVRPRPASPANPADPPAWFTYGRFDHYQDLDFLYGGWDRDAMQADVAAPGPRETDRLLDWTGGYNVFYVCPGAYGEGTITRQGSPHLMTFMQQVADADGALESALDGTSGFREFAYVFPDERGANSHEPHPDHPGHFTCDDESIFVEPEPTIPGTGTEGSMHVAQMQKQFVRDAQTKTWTAIVTIDVADETGAAVADVAVSGNWSTGESATCTTSAEGVCSVQLEGLTNRGGGVTFTVTELTHASLTHDGDADVVDTAGAVEAPLQDDTNDATFSIFTPLVQR